MLPQGYGIGLDATANWGLVHMLHNLTARPGRQVYLTWQIDWVPQTDPERTDISRIRGEFMDVANGGRVPGLRRPARLRRRRQRQVHLPRRRLDRSRPIRATRRPGRSARTGPGRSPRASPTGSPCSRPAATCIRAASTSTWRWRATDPTPGTTDGDDPAEVKPLFRSDAHYYEPAGAVSWDVAMTVARRDWRIHLEPGDTVSINATYNVRRASWYESMGILSLGWTPNDDPNARDPFEDAAAVRVDVREGGRAHPPSTAREHRYPRSRRPRAPGPAQAALRVAPRPRAGVDIDSFLSETGGFSAVRELPGRSHAPARDSARRHADLHQPRRALRPAAGRAGLAHDHRLPRSVQQGVGDRLPAGERPGRLRLRPARLRHRAERQRHDRLQQLHDAAVGGACPRRSGGSHQAAERPTPTSAASIRSCAAPSGSAGRSTEARSTRPSGRPSECFRGRDLDDDGAAELMAAAVASGTG